MSVIKSELRFPQTPPPPTTTTPISNTCRPPHTPTPNPTPTRTHTHTPGDLNTSYSSPNPNTSPKAPTSTMVKPEITFSIERILGLNSHRADTKSPGGNNFPHNVHHQQMVVKEEGGGGRYTTVFHRGYGGPGIHQPSAGTHPASRFGGHEDYDDEDVDEDGSDDIEDDDDEYIDVDADDADTGHYLARSSGDLPVVSAYSKFDLNETATKYQWLQCTRYHPPKIQRSKKAVTKKRKLGRNPRVPFTPHQVSVLEEKFRRTHYLSSMDVVELSTALNLTETRVKIWFQNRRARERRDKEASARNQNVSVVTNSHNNNTNTTNNNKTNNFQPLTIPSVAWPITSSVAEGNYPRFDGALNFRPGYLSSAFRLYSPSAFAAAAAAAAAAGVGVGVGGVRVDSMDTKNIPE